MSGLTSWLLTNAELSSQGEYSIPLYTKIIASALAVTRLCGGIEECLTLLFFTIGICFALRSKCQAHHLHTRQVRRSLVRSPMTVCFVVAAVCFRARPRAIRWPIPASDYFTLRTPHHHHHPPLLAPSSPLRDALVTNGKFFRDELNRVAILRGVNVGGSSKLPTRPVSGDTFRGADTLHVDAAKISFVDRPFPLSEADEHFGRLAAWGLTFLRLQITWEAVEHAGPGIYDQEYLDYLLLLVRVAAKYNINVFIDPHQDVWSRFTGGSGAPRWTLAKVGFDVENLHHSGAAFVHQEWVGKGAQKKKAQEEEDESADRSEGTSNGSEGKNGNTRTTTKARPLPGQVWGHNYARLGSATMFSLFFGGNDFAPNLMVEGEPVQEYLQNKYCAAIAKVASVLQHEQNVIGFDTLNEPSNGFIGFEKLNEVHTIVPFLWDMSPFSLMAMAAGFRYNNVPFYNSPMVYDGSYDMNPEAVSAWKGGSAECIWRKHGVWDIDPATQRPRILLPNYFKTKPDGSEINFTTDYMVPFFRKFEKAIRQAMPTAVIFAEPHINIALAWKETVEPVMPDVDRYVWVPHYYDLLTLLSKSFRKWVVIDPLTEAVSFDPVTVHAKMLLHQLEKSRRIGAGMKGEDEILQGSPGLIGETGICFDQNNGEAYSTTVPGEIMPLQTTAYDSLMNGLDAALASVTLWNYSPSNSNLHGDGWNEEDLSIFSYDQQHNPLNVHSGGRGLPAIVRPYASRISGVPIAMTFNARKRRFVFKYSSSMNDKYNVQSKETVIFVPHYQYGSDVNKIVVKVSDGRWKLNASTQSIVWEHDEQYKEVHTIEIYPK